MQERQVERYSLKPNATEQASVFDVLVLRTCKPQKHQLDDPNLAESVRLYCQ